MAWIKLNYQILLKLNYIWPTWICSCWKLTEIWFSFLFFFPSFSNFLYRELCVQKNWILINKIKFVDFQKIGGVKKIKQHTLSLGLLSALSLRTWYLILFEKSLDCRFSLYLKTLASLLVLSSSITGTSPI